MPDKFKNTYRIQSHRRPGWNYAGQGSYFLTMCIQNRVCLFGKIVDYCMVLNDYGRIAHEQWLVSAEIRQEIGLDEFVVMPNHLHGIVIIRESTVKPETQAHGHVETHGRASLQRRGLHRRPKSISSFVAGYKSAVTTQINRLIEGENGQVFTRHNRLWQPNYHDRIIRNELEYQKITQYIIQNPQNWETDRARKDELWM